MVYQSASTLKPAVRSSRHFDIVQVGHLRHEKDPFTRLRRCATCPPIAASASPRLAMRSTPTMPTPWLSSRATSPLALAGRAEPRCDAAAHQARHLLVIASRMEGGANVIVEAITSGVPVIASDISGNIGMLGEHYPGLFRSAMRQPARR